MSTSRGICASGIAFDELILVGRCPFDCGTPPAQPDTFERDYALYQSLIDKSDSLPGNLYHIETLGNRTRVTLAIQRKAFICNWKTGQYTELDLIRKTYWQPKDHALWYFGPKGCGHQWVPPDESLHLGPKKLVVLSRHRFIDGVDVRGFRIVRNVKTEDTVLEALLEKKGVKKRFIGEGTIDVSEFVAMDLVEPCPGISLSVYPAYWVFCSGHHLPFVMFYGAALKPIPGKPEASGVSIPRGAVVMERGHIHKVTDADESDFDIPPGFREECTMHSTRCHT